jgi:hypothetical protein
MITQAVVSRSLPFFVEGFHKRLRCGYGYDPTKNTFFVGMYNLFEFNRIRNHKALSIVIFCGSDAFLLGERPWFGKEEANALRRGIDKGYVRLVSISEDVELALSKIGLPSRRYNVCPTDEDKYKVTAPTSKRVYVYYNEAHKGLFDWNVYEGLVRHYEGSEVEIEDVHSKAFVNPIDMPKVYENCFVGMKPYLKDGYGNTQVELALSGRRCVSNGQFSGNLRYGGLKDAIAHIDKELKNVNNVDGRYELRILAEKELQLPTGFNQIEFWR